MQLNDQIAYWIWLSMVPGIGNHFLHQMIREGIHPRMLYDCVSHNETLPCSLFGKNERQKRSRKYETLRSYANKAGLDRAKSVLDTCVRKHIRVFIPADKTYPDRMRNIDDMPVILYVRGALRINQYPVTCGIVGARRCTRADMETAVHFAENACRKGIPVISGMAKGIDSYAHTAAILNQGYTIAVLGNGPDVCYPSEHRKLMDAIIEQGAVLSAYMPGMTPRKYYFPMRNKVIAALSDTLAVIGAGRNSGTATTVDFYKSLGRKDLVVQ